MFEMRTNSRSISITSLFITRSHYSNLYNRIERFVRFLRKNHALTRTSLFIFRNFLKQDIYKKEELIFLLNNF